MWWKYEKGPINLDFATPHTLLIDHRNRSDEPYDLKPFTINFVNESEFFIEGHQWGDVNYFRRTPKR
jgi:hypothetical protein